MFWFVFNIFMITIFYKSIYISIISTISINYIFSHLNQSYIYKSTLKLHKQVQNFIKIFRDDNFWPYEIVHEFFDHLRL